MPDESERSRLVSLTIENFRGIRDRQRFNLDANVVVIWGPNGTGKTTIFDAVLWLLQGSLPRLGRHTMRKNDEFIVSAYRPGARAVVEAELLLRGRVVQLDRQGDSRSSLLTVKDGENEFSGMEAEALMHRLLSGGDLPIPEVLATSGLLQQDDLRQLLRDKPDARYRQLLRLLGLESLEQFERFAETEYKTARATFLSAKAAVDSTRARLKELEDQVQTVLSLSANSVSQPGELQALEATIERSEGVLYVRRSISNAAELSAILAEADDTQSRVNRIVEKLQRLPDQLPVDDESSPSDDLLARSLDNLTRAEAEFRSAQHRRDSLAESHDKLMALVGAAIPLLEAHTHNGRAECPVCGTVIDSQSVIENLSRSSASGTDLANAEGEVSAASERRTRYQSDLAEAQTALAAAELRRQGKLNIERSLAEISADLRRVTAGDLVGLKFGDGTLQPETAPQALPWIHENRERLITALRASSSALLDLVSVSSSASRLASAREDSINRSGQLPRLEARREVLSIELRSAQGEYEAARKLEGASNALRHATASGTEEIFRNRFEYIEPLMNDIYGRLDPHPTFTKLDFAIDRYRSKGTATASVTDEAADVHANPLLVFSSAQANVVVLSAFLALGWAASDHGLPFVFMDDPLQSLDDVNVLGFADLVRQLRSEKQVILSTHEERFARLIERKLAPHGKSDSLLIHRFLSWSRGGPTVETRTLPSLDEGETQLVS
jgi:DNA repair exonuclease SbcCD ATPase subunit